jgi:CO/xanthine dehydrogenase Mo-binding subunit
MTTHLEDHVIPPSRQREKPRSDLKWIGKNMKRVEDPRLLTGKGRYIDDIALPNMAHAAVLKSPHAHARVVSIDTSKAEALPGVVTVFTAKDAAESTGPVASFSSPPVVQHCMAIDKIRHVGEVVAAVVAEDPYIAEDALDLIVVEYELLPVNTDPEEAIHATGDAVIHPGRGPTNCCFDEKFMFGPVDEDFARADLVVRRKVKWARSGGTPIETLGAIAEFDEGTERFTCHANTSFYNVVNFVIAGALKVPASHLKVIPTIAGGSFGSKIFTHKHVALTCALARAAGRPVKLIQDRLDNFLNSDAHGSDRTYDAELAMKRDGTLLSLRFRVIDDYGAYFQFGAGHHGNAMAQVTGPYRINSIGMHLIGALTNKCQQGAYRGFGSEVTNFLIERMVDAAADELGMDPIELRRKNLIEPHEFPYVIPTGNVYDSGNYQAVLAKALELIGYDEWKSKQADARARGRCVGIGVATCQERSVYSPTEWWSLNPISNPGFALTSVPEGICVRIDSTGKIFAQLNAPFWGNSPETVVTQVLAEQFTVDPSDIVIGYTDSDSGFNGFGPGGSRYTVMVTGAAVSAAEKLKVKLKRLAGHLLETDVGDLELRNGAVGVKGADAQKSIADLALMGNFFRMSFPDTPEFESGLETTAVYDHPLSTPPHPERKHLGIFYPIMGHMCHVAVIEVDPGTGKVDFLDYAAVHDAGTMVNPRTLGGHIRGGAANGIGTALFEEYKYDREGQFINANFADYGMPTVHEVPKDLKIGHIETPSPYTEYGIKGGGEGGRMGAPAAIARAVEDALSSYGVRIDGLPIPPGRLRDLIREAETSRQHPRG